MTEQSKVFVNGGGRIRENSSLLDVEALPLGENRLFALR